MPEMRTAANCRPRQLALLSIPIYLFDGIYAGTMEAHLNQLTLRKIPGPVERKLRAEAMKKGKSINKTAIEMLEKALGGAITRRNPGKTRHPFGEGRQLLEREPVRCIDDAWGGGEAERRDRFG
jgi:plasmid stability protein